MNWNLIVMSIFVVLFFWIIYQAVKNSKDLNINKK